MLATSSTTAAVASRAGLRAPRRSSRDAARAMATRPLPPVVRTAGRVPLKTAATSSSVPPSYAPAGSELELLSGLSGVVPDSMLSELEGGGKPRAATVNAAFILGVLKSPYGQAEFKVRPGSGGVGRA